MSYKVGIVGATGAVGQELIRLLHDRNFPVDSLSLLASSRSAGKEIRYGSKTWTVEETTPQSFDDLDVAIIAAGASISRTFSPEATRRGCIMIDNTSAYRMDPNTPLIVPEVNPEAADGHNGIIANPNCSTAVALMGLYPLHREFGLKRFFAATYQAVSGSGVAGIEELENQLKAWSKGEALLVKTYPHQIAFNLLPHVDVFFQNGYTKEEEKMLYETRKIMGPEDLRVSTTCVRVPVQRAHSIAINAEFEKSVCVEKARQAIIDFDGSDLVDDPQNNQYPMPLDFSGKAACGVGRIRKDAAFDNGLSFFVVGDQLWKGAALNAVQIAELLHRKNLISTFSGSSVY